MTTNGSSPPVQTGLLEPIDFDNELPMAGTTSAPVDDRIINAQYNKDLLITKPKAEKKTRSLRFDMSKPEQAAAFKQWDEWVNTNANAGARTMDCILLHKPLTLGDVDYFTKHFPAMTAAIQIKSDGVLQAEVDDLKNRIARIEAELLANTNMLAWIAPIVRRVDNLMKQAQMKTAGIVAGVQNKLKGKNDDDKRTD